MTLMSGRAFKQLATRSVPASLFVGAVLLWTPQVPAAQGVRAPTHTATCRDTRVPASSSQRGIGSSRLRLEVDADGDGVTDVLEADSSAGSGFSGTAVQLTLGRSGTQLKARESFNFTRITAINPVPKKLLEPRYRGALAWIEEALFSWICTSPDPSLAWLLDPTKRLTWIESSPQLPDTYAIRLPARRVAALRNAAYSQGKIDPDGEVWLFYAGGVHEYAEMVELARQGDRVLLGTAHGVILTNPERSRHAWIYVYSGELDVKLRLPSIGTARLDGDTAVIRLKWSRLVPDDSSPEGERRESVQVRVNLNTGAVSK